MRQLAALLTQPSTRILPANLFASRLLICTASTLIRIPCFQKTRDINLSFVGCSQRKLLASSSVWFQPVKASLTEPQYLCKLRLHPLHLPGPQTRNIIIMGGNKKKKTAALAATDILDVPAENPITPPRKQKKQKRNKKKGSAPVETVEEVQAQVAIQPEEETVVEEVEKTKKKRVRRIATDNDVPAAMETEEVIEEEVVVKKKVTRRKRSPDPLPCTDPTPELLELLSSYTPPPRPVPNLGYACLNMDLRELKPPVFTSRDCIKRTVDEQGVEKLGELTLANCKDLARVIQWNHEHSIRLFRISSVIQPWMGVYSIEDFPQLPEIKLALEFAGKLARKYDQRLTFHPSHFVKLGTPDDVLAEKSMAELEAHSKIFDLMGYEPSVENKINIHVGGVYSGHGDKMDTMRRWAANYMKLSPNCRARMTIENDDVASAFSLEDLLELHKMCGVPLVFDFHHHKFCPGSLTEEQAFKAAIATWPDGIRPIVHWSESQRGRKPHAHSDYVKGPIFLHGLEAEVDVMIESKCKERALLCYRDGLPIPEEPETEEPELGEDAEVALRFIG